MKKNHKFGANNFWRIFSLNNKSPSKAVFQIMWISRANIIDTKKIELNLIRTAPPKSKAQKKEALSTESKVKLTEMHETDHRA